MKKVVIYILVIIAIIILGIMVGKSLVEENKTAPVISENKNQNKIENNIKNEIKNDAENIVENENIEEEETVEDNEQEEEKPKTNLEKAIDIVKKEWGEDNTVYFAEDMQTEQGDYIICVRDNETTDALAWFKVNLKEGTCETW